MCSFADGNTLLHLILNHRIVSPILCLKLGVISRLENDVQKTLAWFASNMMVANPSKFHVMFTGLGNDCKLCVEIDKMVITIVDKFKLLRLVDGISTIILDSKPDKSSYH